MADNFILESAAILSRTPAVVDTLLRGLPEPWTVANEGEQTWNAYDVIGHFIHGERTDWIARMEIILTHGESMPFTPFDRFAQFKESKGKTLDQLLDDFAKVRKSNLKKFSSMGITEEKLDLTGMHPALGRVTLKQLIAAWVVHDLTHLNQINRVMAQRHVKTVGPWIDFLSILTERKEN